MYLILEDYQFVEERCLDEILISLLMQGNDFYLFGVPMRSYVADCTVRTVSCMQSV